VAAIDQLLADLIACFQRQGTPLLVEPIDAIWTGDGFSDSESWIVDFQNGTADHAKNKSRLVIVMVSSSPN